MQYSSNAKDVMQIHGKKLFGRVNMGNEQNSFNECVDLPEHLVRQSLRVAC